MKRKITTLVAAIILALAVATIGDTQEVSGQNRRGSRRTKATKKLTVPQPPPEDPDEIEGKRQIAELAKLLPEQLKQLKEAIDLNQFVIRKVRISDFPKYFLEDELSGTGAPTLQKKINKCEEFLPNGLMRTALISSFNALIDAHHLKWSMETGIVDPKSVEIIDRYKLDDDAGLYLLTRQVLEIAAGGAEVAAQMYELIPRKPNG